MSSPRHLFCNYLSLWKNVCHLWREEDHSGNWYIPPFVTLSIWFYRSCLHTCDSSACSHRNLCCDFLVLAASINIATIIIHLLAQTDSTPLSHGTVYLFKLKFNFTCSFDKTLTLCWFSLLKCPNIFIVLHISHAWKIESVCADLLEMSHALKSCRFLCAVKTM